MKPLLGIELDDTSHQRNSRQEQDEFVEKVFQAVGLPLLRFAVQREYNPREIAVQIAPFLKDKIAPSDQSPPASKITTPSNNTVPNNAVHVCPKCGIPIGIENSNARRTQRQAILRLCKLSALS